MSILIKGMEMPMACVFCELYDGDLYWCRGAKKEVPYSAEDKRAEFCPLVEIPPHGRLIDADALIDAGWQLSRDNIFTGKYEIALLSSVPTIIEAEEGER